MHFSFLYHRQKKTNILLFQLLQCKDFLLDYYINHSLWIEMDNVDGGLQYKVGKTSLLTSEVFLQFGRQTHGWKFNTMGLLPSRCCADDVTITRLQCAYTNILRGSGNLSSIFIKCIQCYELNSWCFEKKKWQYIHWQIKVPLKWKNCYFKPFRSHPWSHFCLLNDIHQTNHKKHISLHFYIKSDIFVFR